MRRRPPADAVTMTPPSLRRDLAARYRGQLRHVRDEGFIDDVLVAQHAIAQRQADVLEAGEPFVASAVVFGLKRGDYVLEPNGALVPVERVMVAPLEVRFRRPDGTFTCSGSPTPKGSTP